MPNYTDTQVQNLVLNKLTRAQYNTIASPSNNELYLITDDPSPLTTYVSNTDLDVPLIGQASSVSGSTAQWSSYGSGSQNWYGVIPAADAKRAKINLSTGLATFPCGVCIGTTSASAGNSQLKFQRTGVNYIWAPYAEGDHGVWIAVNSSTNTAAGGSASAGNVRLKVQSNRIDALVALYGAVWNDYAEYRQADVFEPGRCIKEKGDDTLELTTQRLERGCEIISDTFGFAIGETDNCKTPIAASGRVLAYPYEDREEFRKHIGYPVCSGPNGTVSIMTEEEEEKYPSRIIGTISAVPDYEVWGSGNVKVNGRVWIRIR